MAPSCSSLDPLEREMGSSVVQRGVTVDQRHDQIVVADGNNHRIQIFDEQGAFLLAFGLNGDGDGQFSYPRGVVVDQRGNYVVSDSGNHRVQIFNSLGQFVRKFGSYGKQNGQMDSPWGVGLLSNGNIVVSENHGGRLQNFDPEGNFVRIVSYRFSFPQELFVDSDDTILVADAETCGIEVFHQNGHCLKTIEHKGSFLPRGVCMDREGRIIISEGDDDGHIISIF